MLPAVVMPSGASRGLAAISALSVDLPAGRLVHGNEGSEDLPALWVSEAPATAQLWVDLRRAHRHSGLWPLLLDSLHGDDRRPWDDGELWPADVSRPSAFDPEELLARWWSQYTETHGDDNLSAQERVAVTAPFGRQWPGLAAAAAARHDLGAYADQCAAELLAGNPRLRLGLVAADRPCDAITVAGWQGAVNYTNDTAELSAVLRSWETRFGAVVVGAGFAELYLSIAAPPTTIDHAVSVAAEHFAFCPDNIWQGPSPGLTAYAERLVDTPLWSFWWD
ncbi:uncharacterized protein DUF4253 [Paractinoplanes brasiliensis]|uniref:Uncharacterized protein DUF4253 n=2 Tax=Paractinoplanes brasiliensis TaxID=52695 RepID=A0A4R6JPG1_9ACTN|nr:uncharacterized protein DUF4253 [Actinoplanes brasiliensis]GID29425.1 hypothetical protein Abr02nite_44080 [Actinoplanes brasiliensis]